MGVDAATRDEILTRYADHARRFDQVAARFSSDTQVTEISEPHRRVERKLTAGDLLLIAEGFTNREISLHLSLSEETVKVHVHRLFGRLRARSRAHAVAIGFRHGIIA